MAKRYHNAMGPAYYEGHDSRRRQEMQDGSMLNEDHNAIANMPMDVKYHEWPKEHGYLPEVLDDTISGIDKQMNADNAEKMKHFKPHKY